MVNVVIQPTLDGMRIRATAYGVGTTDEKYREICTLDVVCPPWGSDRAVLEAACEALLEHLLVVLDGRR